jgi:hypothetical protein
MEQGVVLHEKTFNGIPFVRMISNEGKAQYRLLEGPNEEDIEKEAILKKSWSNELFSLRILLDGDFHTFPEEQ